MSSAVPPNQRWLFGPLPDLLLGCGLGYMFLIGVLAMAPVSTPTLVVYGALVTFFVGMPHYGATLLRVYEQRRDRQRYAFFAVYASAAVWLLFVVGLYDFALGSLLVTVYLTWSPWHYTGQNYGLALMFLRRRGVVVTPLAKRLVYASFILSYLLTFLVVHAETGLAGYAPDYGMKASVYAFANLGIPRSIANVLLSATLGLYAITLTCACVLLLRSGRVRDLGPSALLVATQALWFVSPTVFQHLTGRPLASLDVAFLFLWIAIGHAAQYLWITTYYATASGAGDRRLSYLAKTLLAGAVIWTVPAILFSPGLLGRVPYDMGLFLMVAATVNIQHFILDGAIWKLRDGRIARVLLAEPSPVEFAAPADPRRFAWRPALVWGVGSLSLLISVLGFWEYEFGFRQSVLRQDPVRAEVAARRLKLMGRDNPRFHLVRGDQRLLSGDRSAARKAYAESLSVHETAGAWLRIGLLREEEGRLDQAVEAYQEALELDPEQPDALRRIGLYWLGRDEPERAIAALARASALRPGNAEIRADLERAVLTRQRNRRQGADRGG